MLNLRNHRPAFSLVELLVSISVLAILGAIAISTTLSALDSSKATDGVSKLRSIGTAMNLYAVDNSGYLPGNGSTGPLWEGQQATYDPSRSGRLVRELAPYLDYPELDTNYLNEDFIPIAYFDAVPESSLGSSRIYIMNEIVTVNDIEYTPFGISENASEDGTAKAGMQLNQAIETFPTAWMMSDVDQQHPETAGEGWASSTPSEPIYSDFRNVLFFDGRVEAVSIDDNEFAWID
ncbi:type II secretion system protein [Rubellicoccus peritrichatus]|uniref:Type II secretion system protein n=1 Tax=Rubellicoccus peritrichatus TaxID=3080537 RepID=A0AAQ3LAJ7_9BACT|nr:type II secretion system protein [Puniceicoccus sp. CR14]WOO42141.1 type II secretion system protein [Puniceicoccus sp. CR14]